MLFADIQIALVNLTIGIIILILGITYFFKTKEKIALCIGIASGFFGTSNLFLLSDHSSLFVSVFLSFRIFGYSLICGYLLSILISKLFDCVKTNKTIKNCTNIFIPLSIFALALIFVSFYYFYTLYQQLKLNLFPKNHIYYLNEFFGIVIIILAYLCYIIKKNKTYLFLSVSFIFFAFSHIVALFDIGEKLTIFFVIIRLSAYLFIFLAIISSKNKKFLAQLNKYVSKPSFQVSIVIISIFALIIMFSFPQADFRSSDTYRIIEPINPQISDEKIVELKTGIFIKNFPVFDTTNNDFIMNAIVWFEFDPHLISIENIEKFSFEKGTILEKSKPEVKIINEKLFARYKVKIQFQSNLNYDLFPIEDHTISIALINTHLNPKEIVLISNNSNLLIKDKIFTGDWKQINSEVYYGYSISQIDKFNPEKTSTYPTVVFLIDFEKTGVKDSLIIFVPLYIALFLSLFSLILSINNTKGMLSLSVGSISALLFDLFILEKLTPDVSYFTLSDKIFAILLVSVFAILLFNMFVIRLVSLKKHIPKLIILRNYAFISLLLFIILFTYYVLL